MASPERLSTESIEDQYSSYTYLTDCLVSTNQQSSTSCAKQADTESTPILIKKSIVTNRASGNDLSRVLSWGKQYDITQLFKTLPQIFHAQPVVLDCWEINFETLEMTTATSNPGNLTVPQCLCFVLDHPKIVPTTNLTKHENHLKPVNHYFFRYISFGLDAAIILDFHIRRLRDPTQFTSSLKNKIFYLNESRKYFKEFLFPPAWNLGLYMKLICDAQNFDRFDSILSYISADE
ncbi:unnamed protein product [Rotaria socialis]|uniref:Diacylglycerol kinase accessory domain-containing protein n=1 Tax=Rotaria socialis TaxID=392032 RepID=A0A818K549_9BILA|nr:unnamed protein product [Rotaria socialis]CAF4753213.1 unnamed protein product [Rotaria socialis]